MEYGQGVIEALSEYLNAITTNHPAATTTTIKVTKNKETHPAAIIKMTQKKKKEETHPAPTIKVTREKEDNTVQNR